MTTDDGYILGMQRVSTSEADHQNHSRPAVFMAHCLVCNGGEFVFGPPEKSLGYILADQGKQSLAGQINICLIYI